MPNKEQQQHDDLEEGQGQGRRGCGQGGGKSKNKVGARRDFLLMQLTRLPPMDGWMDDDDDLGVEEFLLRLFLLNHL